MSHIDLAVTSRVISQVEKAGANQRQIAIKAASRDLLEKIATANKNNCVLLSIAPEMDLMVGDTGAIWYTHQETSDRRDSFISLYNSLAENPDFPKRFNSK